MGALEKLTDLQVRQAKPRAKRYKLTDGGGPRTIRVRPRRASAFRRILGETPSQYLETPRIV